MAKHNFSFYAVLLVGVIVAIFFVLYLRKKPSPPAKESPSPQSDDSNVETFVRGVEDVVDDFQLIGIEPNEDIPEMSVSFGKGPGIYGSNRNFSEGIFIKDPNLAPYN